MSYESLMFRCKNGHKWPKRMGQICPYCGMAVEKDRSIDDLPRNLSEVESTLLFERIEPVCGWLACIAGPRQGLSFTLHTGKNFIGRADDMDVRLPGDDAVSRRNHAVIVYDPQNRRFMLLPGDSEGIVYLDGEAVYSPTLILDMSVVKVGRTQLLFRPLCGENFAWQEEQELGEDSYI